MIYTATLKFQNCAKHNIVLWMHLNLTQLFPNIDYLSFFCSFISCPRLNLALAASLLHISVLQGPLFQQLISGIVSFKCSVFN